MPRETKSVTSENKRPKSNARANAKKSTTASTSKAPAARKRSATAASKAKPKETGARTGAVKARVKAVTEPKVKTAPDVASHHDAVARLAYDFWEARGCPNRSPEADWYRAEKHIRNLL